MTLNDFIGEYLGTTFGKLTDKLEDEFGIELTESDLENEFDAVVDDPENCEWQGFGYRLFGDLMQHLEDKLSEEYAPEGIYPDLLHWEYDGANSKVYYKNIPFTTRRGFDVLVSFGNEEYKEFNYGGKHFVGLDRGEITEWNILNAAKHLQHCPLSEYQGNNWSYEGFYIAAKGAGCGDFDFFYCVEEEKVFVPAGRELMLWED